MVEWVLGVGEEGGGAVFAAVAGGDGAAEFDVEELHSVADAEDGDVEGLEGVEVEVWGVGVGGGFGAAGEDDGAWFAEVGEVFEGVEFGEESEFADAADDELGVLGAEVEDGDVILVLVHGGGKWVRVSDFS